ncbi:hypothetical protein [Laceyella putida]|uniref:Uncharacterized protein n=1 Tax=Laceyella putida TaxID=110101 RepID=A0ABW2RF69_9BACL
MTKTKMVAMTKRPISNYSFLVKQYKRRAITWRAFVLGVEGAKLQLGQYIDPQIKEDVFTNAKRIADLCVEVMNRRTLEIRRQMNKPRK